MSEVVKKNGFLQESDGSFSFRRLAALLCLLASIGTGIGALWCATAGWFVFIPCLGFLAGAIIFVFFTTWESVAGIVSAWKGKNVQ